jgi:hypothetical protein
MSTWGCECVPPASGWCVCEGGRPSKVPSRHVTYTLLHTSHALHAHLHERGHELLRVPVEHVVQRHQHGGVVAREGQALRVRAIARLCQLRRRRVVGQHYRSATTQRNATQDINRVVVKGGEGMFGHSRSSSIRTITNPPTRAHSPDSRCLPVSVPVCLCDVCLWFLSLRPCMCLSVCVCLSVVCLSDCRLVSLCLSLSLSNTHNHCLRNNDNALPHALARLRPPTDSPTHPPIHRHHSPGGAYTGNVSLQTVPDVQPDTMPE